MLVRRNVLIAAAAGMIFAGGALAQQQDPVNNPAVQPAPRNDASGVDFPMQKRSDDAITTAGGTFVDQIREISKSPATANDRLFVLCASMENACAVDTARQVLQKTQNPEIKKIAQQIVTDHQSAQANLKRAADAVSIQPITTLPPEHKVISDAFFALPEEQFNKVYLSHLKAQHAAAISRYSDMTKLAQNPAVSDYASKALTNLRKHNQMIAQAVRDAGLPTLAETDMGFVGERR